MLSNTAVPKYYEQFRNDVVKGKIPICKEIEMEMQRIDELIENPGIYYDPVPVEKYITFCETELTLVDGSNMTLLDSFKLWAEQIFGWYYFIDRTVYVPDDGYYKGHYENRRIKKRLINRQYLIVGRGAAKTIYSESIHAYYLTCVQYTTQQISVAPTMRQGEEMLNPFKTAIARARGPLFKFMTEGSLQNTTGSKSKRMKLAPTKKGIENFLTNSVLSIYPMSVDKLQGLRPAVSTIDEWLSGDVREDPIEAIGQGASKNDDYIIIATSSEGTVRNGIGDTIKMELMSILKGEYIDPHVSIFWYKLDDVKEVSEPAKWVKANPNIGMTVTYETYQLDVEKAERVPHVRNDILAKRFGIPCEGFTYYFTYEETLPHRRRSFWSMPCSMGADMSQGDDFCSFSFLFPLSYDKFGLKLRSYITERTLTRLPMALREKYEEFIDEGSLIIMRGTVLDMMEVYDDLDRFIIDSDYDIRCFGYDPYNAREFVERWEKENGPYGLEKVIQGSKTESVPLGEIKDLAEDRRLLFDQSIMSFCMGNAIVIQDTNGNKKLMKKRNEEKIDGVASTMDAYIAYKLHKEEFE